jgi:hypothetical protein
MLIHLIFLILDISPSPKPQTNNFLHIPPKKCQAMNYLMEKFNDKNYFTNFSEKMSSNELFNGKI